MPNNQRSMPRESIQYVRGSTLHELRYRRHRSWISMIKSCERGPRQRIETILGSLPPAQVTLTMYAQPLRQYDDHKPHTSPKFSNGHRTCQFASRQLHENPSAMSLMYEIVPNVCQVMTTKKIDTGRADFGASSMRCGGVAQAHTYIPQ